MESYTFIPEVEFEEWAKKLSGRTSIIQEISYGVAEFKWFEVREVFIDGKQNGEYHIKIKSENVKSSLAHAVVFFMEKFPNCKVGPIDPTFTLGLEYHIYIKTDDPMRIMSMMESMESIDSDLKK